MLVLLERLIRVCRVVEPTNISEALAGPPLVAVMRAFEARSIWVTPEE
jgi:hypothetical protein